CYPPLPPRDRCSHLPLRNKPYSRTCTHHSQTSFPCRYPPVRYLRHRRGFLFWSTRYHPYSCPRSLLARWPRQRLHQRRQPRPRRYYYYYCQQQQLKRPRCRSRRHRLRRQQGEEQQRRRRGRLREQQNPISRCAEPILLLPTFLSPS
ncbi:unnamed protein product, partial [Ectocarpus sp. 12 AP-2014]